MHQNQVNTRSGPPNLKKRGKEKEDGFIAIILLIVTAIIGIVIWVTSSGNVDSGEGASNRNSSVYSSLVQQGQAIENGFAQIVGSGILPGDVLLTDIFSSTLTKPLVLPIEALTKGEPALTTAAPNLAAGNWSFVTIVDATAGISYVSAVAGPIAAGVCVKAGTARIAGTAAASLASIFTFSTNVTFPYGPVPGCIKTSDNKYFFMYPLSKH